MSSSALKCSCAETYQAMRPPECNDGEPCQACVHKWKTAQRLRTMAERAIDAGLDPHRIMNAFKPKLDRQTLSEAEGLRRVAGTLPDGQYTEHLRQIADLVEQGTELHDAIEHVKQFDPRHARYVAHIWRERLEFEDCLQGFFVEIDRMA